MKNQKGFTLTEVIFVIIIFALAGGWIANIVKLAGMSFDHATGVLILRAIGVFIPPLGAVMGYL